MWVPKLTRREDGQSVVIVAMAMAASIAFLALVLDVGFVYGERRGAQNSADAGALAGGRELMRVGEDTVIWAEIQRFAGANSQTRSTTVRANYIDLFGTQELGQVGSGSVPADAKGVRVTVTLESNSFFAGFLGQDRLRATAVAATTVKPPAFAPIAVNGWYDNAVDSYVHEDSPNYGLEYPMVGADARSNTEPQDVRSYINLDVRSDTLTGTIGTENWHILNDDNSWTTPYGSFSPDTNYFDDKNLEYIRRGGYAKTLPTVATMITPGTYISNNVPLPYASVPYFSGARVGHAVDAMKENNYQNGRYAVGSRIPVLVYDGTTGSSGNDKRVTVIGFAVVEITRYTADTAYCRTVVPIQTDYRQTEIIEDVRLSL